MKFKLLFIFWCLCLFASEEIEVMLPTQAILSPVSVVTKNEGFAFSANYLSTLESILIFDLNHNGYTSVSEKASFTFKINAVEKKLIVEITSDKIAKKFDPIVLSGSLNSDRRIIHKFADNFLNLFLKKEGIASSKILYSLVVPSQEKSKWISEVWICDYDGANNRQITHEGKYCVHPLFIPNSNNLFLYVSYKTGQPKIYLSDLNCSFSKLLVSLRGNQLLPSISKNGDKVAFICDASGRPDLFLKKLDGKSELPKQIFSYASATQASSSFSPDGSKIAFVSDKDGSPRIYVINTEMEYNRKRADCKLITIKNRENVSPSWSPDGTKLAYSAKVDGVRQIWIYDFQKDEEWQLTIGNGNKENPIWAMDSLHIIYNTEDKDISELYIVNLNQPNAFKISNGPGRKRFPVWEPLKYNK